MLPGLMESFIKCCDKGRGGRSTLAKAVWRDVEFEPAVKAGSAHFTVGHPAVSELIIHSSTREGRRRAVTSHAHICALAHKHTANISWIAWHVWTCSATIWFEMKASCSEPLLRGTAVAEPRHAVYFLYAIASKIFSREMPSEKQWLHWQYKLILIMITTIPANITAWLCTM